MPEEFDLADGHAQQTLKSSSQLRLRALFADTISRAPHRGQQSVASFTSALSGRTGQSYPTNGSHVVYSATAAVTAAAVTLQCGGRRSIGIVEPTVLTVTAQFPAAGIRGVAVPEALVIPSPQRGDLAGLRVDALYLATPSNPTGSRLSGPALTQLLRWAAATEVVLVIDMSFRMLDPGGHQDVVAAAEQVGADVLVIDDTGKTLSAGGMKLGVVSGTARLQRILYNVCHDMRESVSEADLLILGDLLGRHSDEVLATPELVSVNNGVLVAALRRAGWSRPVRDPAPDGFLPSTAWIALGTRRDDVPAGCKRLGVKVVPGESYFWSSSDIGLGAQHIRIALLRDAEYLSAAVSRIAEALRLTGISR